MPLARRIVEADETDLNLVDRLYQEWSHPTDNDEPVIIEESDSAQLRPIHLYVIWSAWGELPQVDRSRVVMDAFERLRGSKLTMSVSIAMGLTQEEAHRIGIAYQSVHEAVA